MVTLVVRFIGVFVVMLAMQGALMIAAKVVQRIEEEEVPVVAGVTSGEAVAVDTAPVVDGVAAVPSGVDDATAAAIGLALAMEARRAPASASEAGSSSWAVAGRLQQLTRLPR